MAADRKKTGNIRPKRWIIGFFAVICVGLAGYMGISYYANPLGYFTNQQGLDHYFPNDYARKIKAEYVYEHRDEIGGVVIGGSKTGVLNTSLLEKNTGLRYYNLYVNTGNFADYLIFARFAVERIGVKELLLSISSFETGSYTRTDRGNNYKKPALIDGDPVEMAVEFLSYLVSDSGTVIDAIREKPRNIKKADDLRTGERNKAKETRWAEANHDKYKDKKVMFNFASRLRRLFNGSASERTPAIDDNLAALREIREICDANGVTLRCVITPDFIGNHYTYEWEGYYTYLARLVDIAGEVWDFSGYNKVNLNPYDFYDARHFTRSVSDLMINTMFGKDSMEGFGVKLTPDNIYTYLDERRDDLNALKEEFERTGTVTLYGMDDASYVPWDRDDAWYMNYLDSLYDSEEFDEQGETEVSEDI